MFEETFNNFCISPFCSPSDGLVVIGRRIDLGMFEQPCDDLHMTVSRSPSDGVIVVGTRIDSRMFEQPFDDVHAPIQQPIGWRSCRWQKDRPGDVRATVRRFVNDHLPQPIGQLRCREQPFGGAIVYPAMFDTKKLDPMYDVAYRQYISFE
jgi:hypothetical protein